MGALGMTKDQIRPDMDSDHSGMFEAYEVPRPPSAIVPPVPGVPQGNGAPTSTYTQCGIVASGPCAGLRGVGVGSKATSSLWLSLCLTAHVQRTGSVMDIARIKDINSRIPIYMHDIDDVVALVTEQLHHPSAAANECAN